MQVYGHRQGLQAMRLTDPPLLLLGLPTIPLCLVLAKAVQWESRLLMLWRNHISRLPFIQLFRRKGRYYLNNLYLITIFRNLVQYTPVFNQYKKLILSSLSAYTFSEFIYSKW